MPRERQSITHKFSIAGHEGYITAGHVRGRLGRRDLPHRHRQGGLDAARDDELVRDGDLDRAAVRRAARDARAEVQLHALRAGGHHAATRRSRSPSRCPTTSCAGWPRASSTPTRRRSSASSRRRSARGRPRRRRRSRCGRRTRPARPAGDGRGHAAGERRKRRLDARRRPPLTDTPPVVPARLQGLDLGPACSQCGGMMQRTGSCYTCSCCGNNTGCG